MISSKYLFIFNWDSPYGRLNSFNMELEQKEAQID